jgi:hypothetical protein
MASERGYKWRFEGEVNSCSAHAKSVDGGRWCLISRTSGLESWWLEATSVVDSCKVCGDSKSDLGPFPRIHDLQSAENTVLVGTQHSEDEVPTGTLAHV